MAIVWNYNFNSGSYSDMALVGSADITVAAGAAMAGTAQGVNVLIDDTSDNYIWTPVDARSSGLCRARFYFDINSLTMASSDDIFIFIIRGNSANQLVLRVTYVSGSGYRLYFTVYHDSGGLNSTPYALTDVPHYFEIYLKRATTNSSADGSCEVWIDGVSRIVVNSIDNYDFFPSFNSVRLGAMNKDAGTSGNIFFDELIVNDDGGLIGPVSSVFHYMSLLGVGK